MPSRAPQQSCAQELMPVLAWICAITVALALHYGWYGDKQMVLGQNSSQMIKISSVFVAEIEVKDEKSMGLHVYEFVKPPKRSVDSNWTISKRFYVDYFSHQGISLWLNAGSRIQIKCEMGHGSGSIEDMLVVFLEGEQNVKEFHRLQWLFDASINDRSGGNGDVEYSIVKDSNYYIGILNLSPWSMVAKLNIGISSEMYDTREATSVCSTKNGFCKLKLSFPRTQYFVVTTANARTSVMGQKVQFSYKARAVTYFITVGCLVVVVYLILYYLEVCKNRQAVEEMANGRETDPMLPAKHNPYTYRTNEEGPASSLSCSYEDLYDNKICAICYDVLRDCFFTPCGHCISCYECAQRIVKENKICPICRRLIYKVRRLMASG